MGIILLRMISSIISQSFIKIWDGGLHRLVKLIKHDPCVSKIRFVADFAMKIFFLVVFFFWSSSQNCWARTVFIADFVVEHLSFWSSPQNLWSFAHASRWRRLFFGLQAQIRGNKVFESLQKLFYAPPPSYATLVPDLSHCRPSTTEIISRLEIRQENFSMDRVTNISRSFIEMVSDSFLRWFRPTLIEK